MTDDELDEKLRALLADEPIRPAFADGLVAQAQAPRPSWGRWGAGAALVAAVLSLAVLPELWSGPAEEAVATAEDTGFAERLAIDIPLAPADLRLLGDETVVTVAYDVGGVLKEAPAVRVLGAAAAGRVTVELSADVMPEVQDALARQATVLVLPMGHVLDPEELALGQARRTLGPCFAGFRERGGGEHRLELVFTLEGKQLARLDGLEAPFLDDPFRACVREQVDRWTWRWSPHPVELALRTGADEVRFDGEPADLQAAIRMLKLDDAGLARARESELWGQGMVAVWEPTDWSGQVLAAPRLQLFFSQQSSYMTTRGGEELTVDLVPRRTEEGVSLVYSLSLSEDPPVVAKGTVFQVAGQPTRFGLVQQAGEAWYLVTLGLERP